MRVLVANNAKSEAIWQEIPDIKASDGQVRIAVEAAWV